MKIEPKPEFWATVIRWVDGDTLTMMVDQWFDDFKRITCRVLGISKSSYYAALRAGRLQTQEPALQVA